MVGKESSDRGAVRRFDPLDGDFSGVEVDANTLELFTNRLSGLWKQTLQTFSNVRPKETYADGEVAWENRYLRITHTPLDDALNFSWTDKYKYGADRPATTPYAVDVFGKRSKQYQE